MAELLGHLTPAGIDATATDWVLIDHLREMHHVKIFPLQVGKGAEAHLFSLAGPVHPGIDQDAVDQYLFVEV